MAAPLVVGLPKIHCELEFFNPSENWDGTHYSISKPMEADACVVKRYDSARTITKQKDDLDPSSGRFPIQEELQTIGQMANYYFCAGLGTMISAGVGLYFSFAKRNFNVGGVSIACACALAFSARYFEMQRKRAIFDAANKVISTFEQSNVLLYNRSQYGL